MKCEKPLDCPYCDAPMRATMMVGYPPQPDGWICGACSKGSSHEVNVMQHMVGTMKERGWQMPCGKDPDTGEPLTLSMMYGRYNQAMIIIMEVEARCAKEKSS